MHSYATTAAALCHLPFQSAIGAYQSKVELVSYKLMLGPWRPVTPFTVLAINGTLRCLVIVLPTERQIMALFDYTPEWERTRWHSGVVLQMHLEIKVKAQL